MALKDQDNTQEVIAKLKAEISQLNYNLEQTRYELKHYKNHFEHSSSFATYKLRVHPGSTIYDVIFVSPSFAGIVGCDDPMNHDSWFENVHPGDMAEALKRQEQANETNQFKMTVRMFNNRLSEWRWLHFVGNGLARDKGPAEFVNGIVMDVTEQKRAEKAMLAYQKRLQSLTGQLFLAEEHERSRIAGMLHDSVAQDLSLALFKLGMLASGKTEGPEAIQEIHNIINQAIDDTRTLVSELCPPALCQMGLAAGLRWLAQKAHTEYGLQIDLGFDDELSTLDKEEESAIYRIAAELINNVIRHAEATLATVELSADKDGILLTVGDDGRGFGSESDGFPTAGGFGLFSIEERLRPLGGWLKKGSSTLGGAEVRIFLPLEK